MSGIASICAFLRRNGLARSIEQERIVYPNGDVLRSLSVVVLLARPHEPTQAIFELAWNHMYMKMRDALTDCVVHRYEDPICIHRLFHGFRHLLCPSH